MLTSGDIWRHLATSGEEDGEDVCEEEEEEEKEEKEKEKEGEGRRRKEKEGRRRTAYMGVVQN